MSIIRPLKPGLFIYECARIVILAAALMYMRPEGFTIDAATGAAAFPWLFFAAPGALFPLMALFLWLDVSRYRAYLPLFAAGKCIGIFSLLGWSIISRRVTMIEEFSGGAFFWYAPRFIGWILLSGDFFAMAAILLIIRNEQNMTETPVLDEAAGAPDTEE